MPDRPQLAFRIGVTGARRLPAASVPFIREHVQAALEAALAELLKEQREFGDEGKTEAVYQGVPRLRVISPLARGADRLVAQTALDLKPSGVLVEVAVPMPFPVKEYEQDFTGTGDNPDSEVPLTAKEDLEEFRSLLSRADGVIELDGTHAEAGIHSSAPHAYEAVGKYVVRHSDVLLAVWDGNRSNGKGGTADIVRDAIDAGVPLIWIHATRETAPVWIDDFNTLHAAVSGSLETKVEPWGKLRDYIRHQVAPPLSPLRSSQGVLDKLAFLLKPAKVHPLATYFSEKAKPRRAIWRVHEWLMTLAGRGHSKWSPPAKPVDAIGKYWSGLYTQADFLASEYAARYRSSYVWTIALSTCTLILGTVAGAVHPFHGLPARAFNLALPVLEMACLLLILVNVVAAIGNEWHEKSIEYRLLAELFRKQQTLAIVDWTLPLKSVQHCTDTERLLWVQWLFAATERSAPLNKSPRLPNLERRYWIDSLLREQIGYHDTRRELSHNALELFESIGTVSFLLLILCVGIQLALEISQTHEPVGIVVALLVGILPAISAAFVTLRGYAELQLLVEQSRQMASELGMRQVALQKINLDLPLSSVELGKQALGITTLMLQDLEGWGRLFRGKLMEAG